jgi:putative GTP pyrophosphokinase
MAKKIPPKQHTLAEGDNSDAWEKYPGLIRLFLEQLSDYEQLCDEVAYILRKKLKKANIETASITSRAKTLNSFLEKVMSGRKKYDSPFEQITDFAGARVVCLYKEDLSRIEKIISKDFDIVEKVDKMNDKSVDQFGYGAIHFVVQLGKNSSGARYDNLKELKCEIQTRTVLQDAWAIIQHHLVYKHEGDVPKQLQRKLNGLSGLFENIDDQYQLIKKTRDAYLKGIRESKNNKKEFLRNELNLDSLREYLKWKFPNRMVSMLTKGLEDLYNESSDAGLQTLKDVDCLLDSTVDARRSIMKDLGVLQERYPASVEYALAVALTNSAFRESGYMPPRWVDATGKYIKHQVKK